MFRSKGAGGLSIVLLIILAMFAWVHTVYAGSPQQADNHTTQPTILVSVSASDIPFNVYDTGYGALCGVLDLGLQWNRLGGQFSVEIMDKPLNAGDMYIASRNLLLSCSFILYESKGFSISPEAGLITYIPSIRIPKTDPISAKKTTLGAFSGLLFSWDVDGGGKLLIRASTGVRSGSSTFADTKLDWGGVYGKLAFSIAL